MHCPQCGQQQISEQTRFCSRCGFLLTGVLEVMANNGLVPSAPTTSGAISDSPRRRGVKKGIFLFLSAFLVVPILIMVSIALRMEQPVAPIIGLFLLVGGGLLRVAYALMFESGESVSREPSKPSGLTSSEGRAALPGAQSIPAGAYTAPTGTWRDTNDLQTVPESVTDNTTKLLQKDETDQ